MNLNFGNFATIFQWKHSDDTPRPALASDW